jgi:hypothetical protein
VDFIEGGCFCLIQRLYVQVAQGMAQTVHHQFVARPQCAAVFERAFLQMDNLMGIQQHHEQLVRPAVANGELVIMENLHIAADQVLGEIALA